MIDPMRRNWFSRKLCEKYKANLNEEDELMDYVKSILGNALSLNGAYLSFKPQSVLVFVLFHTYVIISETCALILIVNTIYDSQLDMGNMIVIMHLTLLLIISISVHLSFVSRRYDISEVCKIIKRLSESDRFVDESSKKFMEFVRKAIVNWWPIMVAFALGSILCLKPFYDYHVNSKITIPFPLSFPFDTTTTVGLTVGFVFEILIVSSIGLQLNGGLTMYILIQQNIVFEFNILITSIQNLQRDSIFIMNAQDKTYLKRDNLEIKQPVSVKEFFNLYNDPVFSACYEKKFTDVIKHHHTILRMFFHHQQIAGAAILVVIALSSSMVAVSIYCIMSDVASLGLRVSTCILVVPEVFAIWVICYYGELTSSLSAAIRREIYFTNWIHCSEGQKRSLRIMQANTFNTIGMSGIGFNIRANHETFMTIVNSTYTLINLLFAGQK